MTVEDYENAITIAPLTDEERAGHLTDEERARLLDPRNLGHPGRDVYMRKQQAEVGEALDLLAGKIGGVVTELEKLGLSPDEIERLVTLIVQVRLRLGKGAPAGQGVLARGGYDRKESRAADSVSKECRRYMQYRDKVDALPPADRKLVDTYDTAGENLRYRVAWKRFTAHIQSGGLLPYDDEPRPEGLLNHLVFGDPKRPPPPRRRGGPPPRRRGPRAR
jgi:hypothetical protein